MNSWPTTITALVVDDEESNRVLLLSQLDYLGFGAVSAQNGDEALTMVQMDDFDFIMRDIKMPGLSGMEVLRQLKIRGQPALVIMMTALAEVKLAQEAILDGAADYLTKPCGLVVLGQRIHRVLDNQFLEIGSMSLPQPSDQELREAILRDLQLQNRANYR